MTTPIDPEMCVKTGRLLTEWFEYGEYSDEDLQRKALERDGLTLDDLPKVPWGELSPEQLNLMRRVNGYVASHKNRRWRGNMSQQEVQMRMNEATKMMDPSNYKFLPDDVRERTGLEINPLWMMECLVRSGVLAPKEQVVALKELAQYTHSKAPNISHNTTTHLKPEDWLLELAKEEYQEIEIQQPKQPVERGAGRGFEARQIKRRTEMQQLIAFTEDEWEAMEAEVEADWEDVPDDG